MSEDYKVDMQDRKEAAMRANPKEVENVNTSPVIKDDEENRMNIGDMPVAKVNTTEQKPVQAQQAEQPQAA